MRIDKYIWAVRLFKTRSQAAKACEKAQVRIGEQVIKPAKAVSSGDEIHIKNGAFWRSYRVVALPKSRVGAKLVPEYLTEITSTDILDQIEAINRANRDNQRLGFQGRPTKKVRRDIDRFRPEVSQFLSQHLN